MVVLRTRQTSSETQPSPSSAFSQNIWIPVVVIIGVIILITIGTWARRRAQRAMLASATAASATTSTAATGADAATQGTGQRRARRNRRRASQISTKSLPAYMEEAGDEEVVLVSRQRDPMPTLSENAMRPSMDSDETMPDEHAGTPLLERDPREMPFSNALPSDNARSPVSAVSAGSPNSSEGLMSRPAHASAAVRAGETAAADERGDAPAYFEAVADDRTGEVTAHRTLNGSPTSPLNQNNTSGGTLNRSHSLFRTLFTRNNNNDETSPTGQEAQQSSSSGHRPSNSLSSFRTLSLYRSRSNETNDEEQPSIALRNISAPLAHTLVRTEFTFPKSGPTESQIKFLASRESLGRFGLPFGEEARAEPPSFEAIVTASSSVPSLHQSSPSLNTNHTNGHGRRPSFASSMYPPATEEEDIANLPMHTPSPPVPAAATESSPTPDPPRVPDIVHPRLPDIVTSHATPPTTSPPSPVVAQPSGPAADAAPVVAAAA